MHVPYDATNVFAKIIDGEIPADIISENDNALAFYDVRPQARFHALVIPKGAYRNFSEFNLRASFEERKDFWDLLQETAVILEKHYQSKNNNDPMTAGFRLVTNQGPAAGQEVEHFHVHIMGGEKLGPLNAKTSA